VSEAGRPVSPTVELVGNVGAIPSPTPANALPGAIAQHPAIRVMVTSS
jgi:hypothetical protein